MKLPDLSELPYGMKKSITLGVGVIVVLGTMAIVVGIGSMLGIVGKVGAVVIDVGIFVAAMHYIIESS